MIPGNFFAYESFLCDRIVNSWKWHGFFVAPTTIETMYFSQLIARFLNIVSSNYRSIMVRMTMTPGVPTMSWFTPVTLALLVIERY